MSDKRNNAALSSVKDYISVIGRGQKSGKTLSQVQAKDLMLRLLSGEALPEQMGAVLMLLRMREETVEELAGFLQACRETSLLKLARSAPVTFDFACYAGKRRHLPWFLLAVMALAGSGETVFMHGLEESDSQRLYLDSVYRELGWQSARANEHCFEQLERFGFSYISIAQFHPPMTHLLQTRHTLGLRSCLHSLSKMLNPASAITSIHGIYHRDLDTTHIDVAALLKDNRVACIRGDSGEVEATPEKAFTMKSIEDDKKRERDFPILMPQWSLQTRSLGAAELKALWTGSDENSYGKNAVIATIAVALACKDSLSVQQSLDKAKLVWDSRSGVWPSVK